MSDLGGGRASNGGARTGGPVPVPSTGTPTGIRTPRDVMRDRNAREARRQEEQKAEDARRSEERRRSAERRTAAAVPGSVPRYSQASSQYTPDAGAQQGAFDGPADRRSRTVPVAGSDLLGEPTGRTTQEYTSSRPRGPSATSQDQPRPAQATAGSSRRTQQAQGAPRQPSAASAGAPQQQGQGDAQTRGGASSFPHAFERWENLSSHWEGLTSYWLHKLEQNTEEIRNTTPNASTLNRQITDLSAAGANLFHAVVELQRLRASSERKFQRWFFETRADTERNQEMQGQMERQLKLERSAREEAASKRAEAEDAGAVALRDVNEMRRELMISKEEARRAWEELGRRNQEAIETADSLKSGRVTIVSGVQVVPYFGGPSRTGSASQRPGTGGGPQQYGSAAAASSAGRGGVQSPGDEEAYYRERPSPTDTDPFTDTSRQPQMPLHQEPDPASLAAGTYKPTTSASTSQPQYSGQRPTAASSSQRGPQTSQAMPSSAQEAQRFYQQAPGETFLHSPQSSSQGPLAAGATASMPPAHREDVRSEGSYVDTISEGDTEYAIDPSGNIQHDSQGRPIPYSGRRRASRVRSEESDDYDEEAIRHEQELAARYGGGGQSAPHAPEAPTVPATSAQAMAGYTPATSGPASSGSGGPDYEGQGYGGWDALQTTRHHHPTRLSDVLEEEEERSSRRTAGD